MQATRAFDSFFLSSLPVHHQASKSAPTNGRVASSKALPQNAPSSATHRLANETPPARRPRACERCRTYRRRCDGGRPCGKCRMKAFGQTCPDCDPLFQEEQPKAEVGLPQAALIAQSVHRPMEFESRIILLPDRGSTLSAVSVSESLAKHFSTTLWMSDQVSRRLIDDMPRDLLDVVVEGMCALRVNAEANQCREKHRLWQAVIPGVAMKIVDDSFCEDAFYAERFNLDSCSHCAIEFNRRFAVEMCGTSPDELLTRLAFGEVEIAMSQLDFLCHILDNLLGMNEGMHQVGYHLLSHANGRNVLVRSERSISIAQGVCSSQVRMRAVSPAEYDLARLSTPNRCRPFAALIGDLRTSRQLLEETPGHLSFSQLQRSPQGLAMLAELVLATRARFHRVTNGLVQLTPPTTSPPPLSHVSALCSAQTSSPSGGVPTSTPDSEQAWVSESTPESEQAAGWEGEGPECGQHAGWSTEGDAAVDEVAGELGGNVENAFWECEQGEGGLSSSVRQSEFDSIFPALALEEGSEFDAPLW